MLYDNQLKHNCFVAACYLGAISCIGANKTEDPVERHINAITSIGYGVTNSIPQLVANLNNNDRGKRLKSVSDLFACAFVSKATLNSEKIGDKIVDAYGRETYGEIKAAMLATLDLLGHPALSNLLVQAGQSTDPEMRNLVHLIKEKKYLQPVVTDSTEVKRP